MASRLTPEQFSQLKAFARKWRSILIGSGPTDRGMAEEALHVLYESHGATCPRIVWHASPLAPARETVENYRFDGPGEETWPDYVTPQGPLNKLISEPLLNLIAGLLHGRIVDEPAVWNPPNWQAWAINGENRLPFWSPANNDRMHRRGWRLVLGESTVLEQIQEQIDSDLALDDVRKGVTYCGFGQLNTHLALLDFVTSVCGIERTPSLQASMTLAQACAFWWPYPDKVLVVDRPAKMSFNEQSRLHSAAGPALSFPDGWAIYSWHGVTVPRHVIEAPETITMGQIEAQRDHRVRSVMTARMTAQCSEGRYFGSEYNESETFGRNSNDTSFLREVLAVSFPA